jgi:hypothetical protein
MLVLFCVKLCKLTTMNPIEPKQKHFLMQTAKDMQTCQNNNNN